MQLAIDNVQFLYIHNNKLFANYQLPIVNLENSIKKELNYDPINNSNPGNGLFRTYAETALGISG